MSSVSVCSRRTFVGAGAAALGLGGLLEAGENQPERRGQRDPFGGFIVGVQSYSFRQFNLEQCLTRIRDLGLHFVEFFRGHVPLDSSDDQIHAVRNLCFQYNITPIAFGVEPFTKDHDANRRRFEFARKLGVRYLSADPTPESFDSLDRLVAEFGIGIAIHPHGPVGANRLHPWYSAEIINKAISGRHRLIGTCLDTGHLIRCAQPPHNINLDSAQQIRHMGQRNFGLHLKDHDNEKRTDVVYGRGALNVAEVLRALRAVNFHGYISIEYEANPQNPSPDMQACINVFKDTVKKLG